MVLTNFAFQTVFDYLTFRRYTVKSQIGLARTLLLTAPCRIVDESGNQVDSLALLFNPEIIFIKDFLIKNPKDSLIKTPRSSRRFNT